MGAFKEYFKSNQTNVLTEAEKTSTETKQKIKTDFETELRKLYKIKSVIYTAFGVQIDFLKKPEKDEILNIIDSKVRFKDKSIFIEFA